MGWMNHSDSIGNPVVVPSGEVAPLTPKQAAPAFTTGAVIIQDADGPYEGEDIAGLTLCSCLACFFCCCPFGLIALHFSSQAQIARRSFDFPRAARYQRTAKIFIILAIVAGIA